MRLFLSCFIFLYSLVGNAQVFSDFFEEQTLRLDYIFAGNNQQQYVFLDEIVQLDGWYGRKVRLDKVPFQGNGQIKVFDSQSGQLIYALPFSSLFQEWLTLSESKIISKSFENSFLIPYPKKEVTVEVSFFDEHQVETVLLKHHLKPKSHSIRQSFDLKNEYLILQKAQVNQPIRIAFVAEGFQENEMDDFIKFAQLATEHLFEHEVFKKHKNAFEVIAVQTISKDSGVSIPSKTLWKDTALFSHFDTFDSERYLTTSRIKRMHQLLENTPYHHVIILANTAFYGGGGILNAFSIVSTKSEQFGPVVVHEFGHSFAGLADEYFYESDVFENKAVHQVEPWEKNITSLVNFQSKWQNLLIKDTPIPTDASLKDIIKVGVFEGLKGNGLYISSHYCRMKTNGVLDFCEVCSRAIDELILFNTTAEY